VVAPRDPLDLLDSEVVGCRACPRLVAWREEVASTKRAAFRDQAYWGRPVPGFGDRSARLLIVGLAPAAHGANRTGRIFTGDRSGDWLYASLWRTGFANQPTSVDAGDGLVLEDAYITAAVRCAPPANQPTPAERDRCRPYLERELSLLPSVQVIVALGRFGHDAACSVLGLRPRPPFSHGSEVPIDHGRVLMGSYHPSQQNTFTGKRTEAMTDAVFNRAKQLLSPAGGPARGGV
jgi:uracil-DNA glycosylase